MRCPFLREEQVKSCQAAPFRKSLARAAAQLDSERCSSPDHRSCPMLRQSNEAHPSPSRCPFLREALAQFCAATPSVTYVPWSASPEQRCAHDGHRFCSVFLGACGAGARRPSTIAADAREGRTELVAGVPMPGWLFYAESHLWLDAGDDGVGHVGIDAFVAQLLGRIERLAFVAVKGMAPPAVVLTVRGVDITLRFPRPLPIVAANMRLRASPDRLTADPYGSGWLFETRLPADAAPGPPLDAGLRHGPEAQQWMAGEVRRVSEWMHGHLHGARLAADGGRFSAELLDNLEPEHVARLLAELFAISDSRRVS
jgi:glycine cleavage system H lipoate-binding protein